MDPELTKRQGRKRGLEQETGEDPSKRKRENNELEQLAQSVVEGFQEEPINIAEFTNTQAAILAAVNRGRTIDVEAAMRLEFQIERERRQAIRDREANEIAAAESAETRRLELEKQRDENMQELGTDIRGIVRSIISQLTPHAADFAVVILSLAFLGTDESARKIISGILNQVKFAGTGLGDYFNMLVGLVKPFVAINSRAVNMVADSIIESGPLSTRAVSVAIALAFIEQTTRGVRQLAESSNVGPATYSIIQSAVQHVRTCAPDVVGSAAVVCYNNISDGISTLNRSIQNIMGTRAPMESDSESSQDSSSSSHTLSSLSSENSKIIADAASDGLVFDASSIASSQTPTGILLLENGEADESSSQISGLSDSQPFESQNWGEDIDGGKRRRKRKTLKRKKHKSTRRKSSKRRKSIKRKTVKRRHRKTRK